MANKNPAHDEIKTRLDKLAEDVRELGGEFIGLTYWGKEFIIVGVKKRERGHSLLTFLMDVLTDSEIRKAAVNGALSVRVARNQREHSRGLH